MTSRPAARDVESWPSLRPTAGAPGMDMTQTDSSRRRPRACTVAPLRGRRASQGPGSASPAVTSEPGRPPARRRSQPPRDCGSAQAPVAPSPAHRARRPRRTTPAATRHGAAELRRKQPRLTGQYIGHDPRGPSRRKTMRRRLTLDRDPRRRGRAPGVSPSSAAQQAATSGVPDLTGQREQDRASEATRVILGTATRRRRGGPGCRHGGSDKSNGGRRCRRGGHAGAAALDALPSARTGDLSLLVTRGTIMSVVDRITAMTKGLRGYVMSSSIGSESVASTDLSRPNRSIPKRSSRPAARLTVHRRNGPICDAHPALAGARLRRRGQAIRLTRRRTERFDVERGRDLAVCRPWSAAAPLPCRRAATGPLPCGHGQRRPDARRPGQDRPGAADHRAAHGPTQVVARDHRLRDAVGVRARGGTFVRPEQSTGPTRSPERCGTRSRYSPTAPASRASC